MIMYTVEMNKEEVFAVITKEEQKYTYAPLRDATYYFQIGYNEGYATGVKQGLFLARSLIKELE